mmetsp:Transcript_570/g.1323  ORF Transcript_570/g.1323 Transcript_570/m.1323 type:complete len:437 (+) Transcript_570:187-1497(+)
MCIISKTETKTVVSTLTNNRGSDGMGLPTEMTPETVATVVATAGVMAPESLEITKTFYNAMFKKHPGLLAYFNPAHNVPISTHQPKALASSIVAYAANIKDLSPLLVPGGPVMAIAHRHCALNVYPAQYLVVYENLMQSIAKVLGDAVTPEVAKAWSEAVLFLAKALIDVEESLYQMAEKREGGWSGPIEFEVAEITDQGRDIKSFSFKPPAGSPLEGSNFEFTPGQYLSLQADYLGSGNLTSPRHYTVTSPPGADYLQCTIKKIPGGKLSTFMHDNVKVGDKVMLTAPFGVFTVDKDEQSSIESVVLMSAGIGVTPMVNFQRVLGEKVKLAVHVDKGAEDHAFKDLFDVTDTFTSYTRGPGNSRMDATALVNETLKKAGGPDHLFLICGPESWMNEVQKELLANGAKEVRCEVFGSQLATECPFGARGSVCPFAG